MTANSVDKVSESLTDFIRAIATDVCPMDEIPPDIPSGFPHVDVRSEASGGKRTNRDCISALLLCLEHVHLCTC